ncbi:hypothetical protein [Litchfieldella rifensis]|uniref:Glycosyltransferase RgtA/B/C/D-like domain-containing protein n=1 Tax=Litchfieldella rifensis TaxID=762643 RepID=A0ABV7LJR8_9GAMM
MSKLVLGGSGRLSTVKSRWLEFLPALFFLAFAIILAVHVGEYGFWRHDAWGYTKSEFLEFSENARWLAPIFHSVTKDMPHYLAWLLCMAMAWGYGYVFLNRFLAGSQLESKTFLYAVPFVVIFQPGLMEQLGWPIHTLAAIFLLFLFSLLSRNKASWLLSGIATILVFGILQTFAFLAVLLAVPSYKTLLHMKKVKVVMTFFGILIFWGFSILVSWLISKLAQYVYFGSLPGLPEWRSAHPVKSPLDLYNNVMTNLADFVEHVTFIYSPWLLLTVVAIFVLLGVALFVKRKLQELVIASLLLVLGTCFLLSVYVFTAPMGTIIADRTTFTFGVALFLVAIAFYVAMSSLDLDKKWIFPASIAFVLLVSIKPMYLSYINVRWYTAFTSDFVNALLEVEEGSSRNLKGVVVEISEYAEKIEWDRWPIDYSHVRPDRYKFMESLNSPGRLGRAFYELGYDEVHFCGGKEPGDPGKCKLVEGVSFERCARSNPRICSGGISDNGYWLLRF